ncbi:D-sedoheptulose 7-phosphate isomerase [Granulicella rosea]|uniref:Phosphoheptose isomerase n=1 Tax=Granulicella rosea TaxID=474952 RepID=A0A239M0M9_9BACT|nr:D-sedoheptulose 7-phosphate isomerase [Granulicella rosea]SNT36231.1 D-sedoheptulose 7-phosphate isomerase [Granulicella rosea]
MTDLVYTQLQATIATMQAVQADPAIHRTLVEIARQTAEAMQTGHKLLVAGNGGSAADAQHLVAEFVVRLKANRAALRAVALTTDTSILTAIGNDFGADALFERQVEALGQPGDVFLAISTSGSSPNILRALARAREQGMFTVGFTGQGGGRMAALCDCLIAVPSNVTMNIQEAHLSLEHTLCLLVERILFGEL